MGKIRVYFLGSGPSIAMGVPSVTSLYSKILQRKNRHGRDFLIEGLVQKLFPNQKEEEINFEELITLLDPESLSHQIYRVSKTDRHLASALLEASTGTVYREIINGAWNVLSDEMGDPSEWEKYSQSWYPNDAGKKKEIMEERHLLEPIRKAWFSQYRKINQRHEGDIPEADQDVVITTNYDVLVEKQLTNKFCYLNRFGNRTLIIKLHGSINWMEQDDSFDFERLEVLFPKSDSRIVSRPVSDIERHVGMLKTLEPVIVPPIAQKKYEDPLFRQMFFAASEILLKADELVILGYGFSDYDFYVKKLIDSAVNSENGKIRNIYHYDNCRETFERFLKVIRKKEVRDSYKPIRMDFKEFAPDFNKIGKKLKIG